MLTYSRIGIACYVSEACERLVLLDPDTLVLTDIGLLFDESLGGSAIGATQDPYIPTVSSVDGLTCYRELGLAKETKYFIARLMLVDVVRWRREKVAEQAAGVPRAVLGQHGHRPVEVFLKQFVGGDQIVFVVLFQHGRCRIGQRLELDAGAINPGGHVGVIGAGPR
ncbi:MAG: glycosyltransferase [Acidobacteriota bacterium]